MKRIPFLFPLVIVVILSASCSPSSNSLFNGKDLEGWRMDVPLWDSIPDAAVPFVVRGGMLVSLGEPRGHLVTTKTYKDYRLEVEYRFPGVPGNCGVLVHASTPRALYQIFPKSIEVQMEHQNAGIFGPLLRILKLKTWKNGEGRNQHGELPKVKTVVLQIVPMILKTPWGNGIP